MDPLTITAAVLKITAVGVSSAKALSSLRGQYKHASLTIGSLCSETTIVSASLSQIQTLFLQDINSRSEQIKSRPDIVATFDIALTGCMVVFSCLDEEVRNLTMGTMDAKSVNWKKKARVIWKEDTMRELLSQIRGQQTALTLLIQLLQMTSINELGQLLRQNNAMIRKVAEDAESLRAANPSINAPESVFEQNNPRNSIFELFDDNASQITRFEFDNIVMQSPAYRRYGGRRRVLDQLQSYPDMIDLVDANAVTHDLVETSGINEGVLSLGLGPVSTPNKSRLLYSPELLAPTKAYVPRYYFAKDTFWFNIECLMEDGRCWELQRLYQDFYDLQIQLIASFPVEAGTSGNAERTLPYMLGPVKYVTDVITQARRSNLDGYVKNLLELPPHISQGTLVKTFFTAREGDHEIDLVDTPDHVASEDAAIEDLRNEQEGKLRSAYPETLSLDDGFQAFSPIDRDKKNDEELSLTKFNMIMDLKVVGPRWWGRDKNTGKTGYFKRDEIILRIPVPQGITVTANQTYDKKTSFLLSFEKGQAIKVLYIQHHRFWFGSNGSTQGSFDMDFVEIAPTVRAQIDALLTRWSYVTTSGLSIEERVQRLPRGLVHTNPEWKAWWNRMHMACGTVEDLNRVAVANKRM
ncbi:hypothetical protein BU16DRAFT_527008 [Lophium mytilinum]|uniref:PX domain-containing protein n=1 Tax=Lophium mytilinum TaxID=390894 RepID=A0A6A6QSN5_9PEZI|nr:hypothetical protein BU16DRAFT_527008 [Lophium mytilinum]